MSVIPPAGMEPGRTRRSGPMQRHSRWSRTLARWIFHLHLWLGILVTGIVILVSITGVLLNHKTRLGLMPEVEHAPRGGLEAALPLAELTRRAQGAVPREVAAAGVDRMDVRPGDGLVKVRFDDPGVVEVTLDLQSGQVLHIGERNDVFLERLHSGEVFGDGWILLSDAAAAVLVLLLLSGYWIWLYPRSRI